MGCNANDPVYRDGQNATTDKVGPRPGVTPPRGRRRFVVSGWKHCYDWGMRKGIGVSPGVAVGTAYSINEIFVNPDTKRLEESEAQAELARYDLARERTATDLHALFHKVSTQVGAEEAAIFQVHESILRDAAFTAKIRSWIVEERLASPAAAPAAGGIHRAVHQHAGRVPARAIGRRAQRHHPAQRSPDRGLAA